jgi:hypothetical protein
MARELLVAFLAGIVSAATLQLNGDNVVRSVIVLATGLRIEIEAAYVSNNGVHCASRKRKSSIELVTYLKCDRIKLYRCLRRFDNTPSSLTRQSNPEVSTGGKARPRLPTARLPATRDEFLPASESNLDRFSRRSAALRRIRRSAVTDLRSESPVSSAAFGQKRPATASGWDSWGGHKE